MLRCLTRAIFPPNFQSSLTRMVNGDDWLARDKFYHVVFCFSISVVSTLLASRTGYNILRRWSIFIGSIVSLAAGAAKEVADQFGFMESAGASTRDAVADLVGVLLAVFALYFSKALFTRTRSKQSAESQVLQMV